VQRTRVRYLPWTERHTYGTGTANSHEAKWRPSITIEGRPLKYNPTPTFLGIKYDRQLTFGGHVEEVTKKVKRRAQAIRKLGNTDWGYEKEVLRGTYIAVGRSVIEYAAPAWIPWISKTNLAAQRYAARAVTGQLKTTPAEAVLIESDLPSIKTRSRQLAISAFDKALRLPEDNPRHGVATREEGIRTKKTDWRDHSGKIWRDIFEGREPDCVESLPCLRPPWEEGP